MTRYAYNCRLHEGKVRICRENGFEELDISFKRTVRVPDNHGQSELPPDLGDFPLYKIRDYADDLPHAMTTKGGVFMPMYRKLNSSQP
jgi:hypothetical protein